MVGTLEQTATSADSLRLADKADKKTDPFICKIKIPDQDALDSRIEIPRQPRKATKSRLQQSYGDVYVMFYESAPEGTKRRFDDIPEEAAYIQYTVEIHGNYYIPVEGPVFSVNGSRNY